VEYSKRKFKFPSATNPLKVAKGMLAVPVRMDPYRLPTSPPGPVIVSSPRMLFNQVPKSKTPSTESMTFSRGKSKPPRTENVMVAAVGGVLVMRSNYDWLFDGFWQKHSSGFHRQVR